MKFSLQTAVADAAGASSDYILHDPGEGPNRRTGFPREEFEG
jgi:hypothetical protein